jgi:alpha-tubulin suppressor-like RCC1 family protein/endonuclease/exonuclease/phosphatase family metal-dependent hydrolase
VTLGTRHHLRKAGAATLLALALTASLLAATSTSVEAEGEKGGTGPTARRSSCADVLLVGLDGNGQRPARGKTFGPAVEQFAGAYARQLGKGRSVQQKRLAVGTPKLAALTAGHLSGKPAAASIRKTSLRRWMASVPRARKALLATLDAAAASCPEQQFVLVGYAQGARTVHGALATLRERSYGDRIAAGVLISDPGHRGGIEARVGRKVDAPPAATDTFGVWNICTTGDLVCRPGRAALGPAVATAQRYHRATATTKKVRAAALDRARRWPSPKPAITVRGVLVDAPIQIALQADAARAGTQWTPTSALPPGVTLSPTGEVSGTVSTRGQWTITYTVAGTAPATTPHSGQLVLSVSDGATSVSSGGQVTCATDGGGGASCWGANQFGQLGNGTTTGSAAPVPVLGTGWQSISTSGASTCGIKVDGTLWCWGLNNFAQLGIDKTAPQKKPRQVAPGTAWSKVSTSWFNTCAITTGGDLYCWGQNLRGAVGTGGTTRLVARPVLVGASGAGWADVSTGGWHTCAVRGDATMWCWGQNTFGQVGTATAGLVKSPVQVGPANGWRQVSTSWGHSCGVTGAGEMSCWGINKDGQLGTGTYEDAWAPQPVGAGQVWTSVSAGDASTCALNGSAQTWCWGGNRYGQLGTATNVSSPVPVLASALPSLTSLTSGWMHGCGLAGPVPVCWGSNEAGQLGASGTAPVARSAVSSADSARARDVVRRGAVALRLSPSAQVEREIGDRPAVSESARRKAKKSFTTKVLTFNLLGSQHTAPSGDRPDWAPGRIRSEWASSLIATRDGSLVGLQEIQPDQVTSLNTATDGRYTFFPGTSMGYAGAPQSVMWRTADWTPVWTDTVTIPFMRNQPRPQPVVRLRNNASGQELYWINAHFSPGTMESDRRQATAIIIRTIRKLQKDGLPILLTGDLNDNHRVFCQVTGKTKLRAALGGSNNNGRCKPPAGRRVDWIFGSVGGFGQIVISQGSQVRRTTDHSVHDVPFTVQ